MSVEYPRNDFTDMIEETSRQNVTGVRRAGVASALPLPTVRSSDLGQEIPEQAPLSPDELAELNRLAASIGMKDERIGTADVSPGAYATLEDAINAGAPVAPVERVPAGTQGMALEQVARNQSLGAQQGRQNARQFLAAAVPRLPDFRRVEGIDLMHNRVLVDGMEFPITEMEAMGFKKFVVETARTAIMDKLSEADDLFVQPVTAEDTPNGGSTATGADEAVQRQSEGSGAQSPE